MKIEIPKTWMGEDIEGSIERVLSSQPASSEKETQREKSVFEMNEPKSYILVPQFDIAVALRETHLNKNMYESLDALAQEGLKMPSSAQFMTHFMNVREAATGSRQLLYADGTSVGDDVTKDLWNYLSSKDRSPWGGKVCWTWLNARFTQGNIETDLEVKADANGKKYLEGKSESLEGFVNNNGLASLAFNSQGLPESSSSVNSYQQGENIHFWKPVDNRVARFDADSGSAGLDCDGGPDDRSASLGVFACAEGTASQNLGGK